VGERRERGKRVIKGVYRKEEEVKHKDSPAHPLKKIFQDWDMDTGTSQKPGEARGRKAEEYKFV